MPITLVGKTCARRDCGRPHYKDGLCGRCWRFARLFDKDPRMLAYQPLHGYAGARDAVELPWEELDLAQLLGEKDE